MRAFIGVLVAAAAMAAWSAPLAAQVAAGGAQVRDMAEGSMRWGATVWGAGTLHFASPGALDESGRNTLVRALEAAGGGVYVEIAGETPADVRVVRRHRRDIFVAITRGSRSGHTSGSIAVRGPTVDIPLVFIDNNEQEVVVVEVPSWVGSATVVVNGRVLLDAARID